MAFDSSSEDHAKKPKAVDIAVGARIRVRRKTEHVSQEKLAAALGLTFQQVQKYERAANRVSASMLVNIAARLETTVAYLVGEEKDPDRKPNEPASELTSDEVALMMSPDGMEIASLIARIPPTVQVRILHLLRAMVDEQNEKA